jgi:hypothetical protein
MVNFTVFYHQVCGALSILSSLFLIPLLFRYKDSQINFYQLATFICLLSISWGIHGLIHYLDDKKKTNEFFD